MCSCARVAGRSRPPPSRVCADWTGSLRLNKAEERVVRVRAWIPEGTDDTTGRRVAVDLELDAELTKVSRR